MRYAPLVALLALSGCSDAGRLNLFDPSYARAPFGRDYEAVDVTGDLQVDLVLHYEIIPCPRITRPCDSVAQVIFAADDFAPLNDDLAHARSLDPTYRAQLSSYLASYQTLHQRQVARGGRR